MSAVRIEESALRDPRFRILAKLLNVDEFSALGRMIHVWSYCTLKQSYSVSDAILDVLGGADRFGEHLVKADLAEALDEGYRIKGTEGRIEWLGVLRESKVKGGKTRAESAKRNAAGTFVSSRSPAADQQEPSSPPAESSVLTLVPVPVPTLVNKTKNKESKGEFALATGSTQLPAKGTQEATKAKAGQFAGAYVKAYQSRYPGTRPEDLNDGKVRGQILTWIKDYPLERACQLVQVYFQMESKWFGTKGYDFLTFRNNLNLIGQALDSGQDPSGAKLNWQSINLEST